MQEGQDSLLDADELLHLAIRATDDNQSDKAIEFLKQLLAVDPKHATAHYLLGAVHAGLGLYDRAIAEMSTAMELDANLPPTAAFQLGLLYMTTRRLDDARSTWSALDPLGEENPLFLFKRGMLHLAEDDFDACITDLQRGIHLNGGQDQLNRDMQGVIERAEAARAELEGTHSSTVPDTSSADAVAKRNNSRDLLAAYERGKEDGDLP
jgi:tetratricopeptide (TPR) repeat protein